MIISLYLSTLCVFMNDVLSVLMLMNRGVCIRFRQIESYRIKNRKAKLDFERQLEMGKWAAQFWNQSLWSDDPKKNT